MQYVDTSGASNLPIISLRGRLADSTLDWATAGSETSCGGAGASSCIRRRAPRWLGPGDAGTNADALAAPTRNNAARRTDGMVAARCASLSNPLCEYALTRLLDLTARESVHCEAKMQKRS